MKEQGRNNLTTTIIDGLRLCYNAEPSLLQGLKETQLGDRLPIGCYSLFRKQMEHFAYGFAVMGADGQVFGDFYFERIGDTNNENNSLWYRVENSVLYDAELLKQALKIPELLDLRFKNFTALDLAKDFTKNISYLILRLKRDKALRMIVNGKAITNRKATIPVMNVVYSVTADKLRSPTVNIRQQNAVGDKHRGICICSYDKGNEIRSKKEKMYIMDFYGHPKTLHRLEVHQNSIEIRDFCDGRKIAQSLDLLFDQTFLTDMFYQHLSSVLRFSKGRKKLAWPTLLGCTDRYI